MSVPRPIAMLPPLMLAASLAACSEQARPPPTAIELPTVRTLPYRYNEECGCVRDGQCVVLEEQPGFSEIRNLACRWVRPGAVAECRFEERFTAQHFLAEGNVVESPGAWIPRRLRATLLPDGRWCAG